MIVRRRCTRRRHKLLVGLGRFKKRESSDCCVAFASSRGGVHARQRNRSAASNIWATPFHICRLLDAQGLFANATISQRAALCCSDFAPIRNRQLTERAELVDGALTLGRLLFLSWVLLRGLFIDSKIDAGVNVCFHGRYWEQSGHGLLQCTCLLLTQSGHRPMRVSFSQSGT